MDSGAGMSGGPLYSGNYEGQNQLSLIGVWNSGVIKPRDEADEEARDSITKKGEVVLTALKAEEGKLRKNEEWIIKTKKRAIDLLKTEPNSETIESELKEFQDFFKCLKD